MTIKKLPTGLTDVSDSAVWSLHFPGWIGGYFILVSNAKTGYLTVDIVAKQARKLAKQIGWFGDDAIIVDVTSKIRGYGITTKPYFVKLKK
jgi:hypothetical protein